MFVTGKPFQPSLIFVGKARNFPYSGVHFKCSTHVGSSLIHKHWTILEGIATDKPSSLLRTFVNYGRKKFFIIGPRSERNRRLFSEKQLIFPTELIHRKLLKRVFFQFFYIFLQKKLKKNSWLLSFRHRHEIKRRSVPW